MLPQYYRDSMVVEKYECPETGQIKRRLIRSNIFNDEQKALFLAKFEESGNEFEARKFAGVSKAQVNRALEMDDRFAELAAEAIESYRSRLLEHHRNLIFEGEKTNRYDKEGNLVETQTRYPIRLIELELKANFEQYRDKRSVDMNVKGGVVIAPAEAGSVEDWEAAHGETIDGECEEVGTLPSP